MWYLPARWDEKFEKLNMRCDRHSGMYGCPLSIRGPFEFTVRDEHESKCEGVFGKSGAR